MIHDKNNNYPEEITLEYLKGYIKSLNEDVKIMILYYNIEKNKELIELLVIKIEEEHNIQLNIETYMKNEYIKIYDLIKEKENNKAVDMCRIFSQYGSTTIIDKIEEKIVIISLGLERSSNCSYIYHRDKFCEKLINLRCIYRKNRGYAYNFIELIKKNNIQYENLEYFHNYLENY